jgi:hypothetical protein
MSADALRERPCLYPPASYGIRSDQAGDGRYGSRRDGGRRRHQGLDFVAPPGGLVFAPCDGTIGEPGICYRDDPRYHYVRIHTWWAEIRVLYVTPELAVGAEVEPGRVIGRAQDVAAKHSPLMVNHVHLEVRPVGGVQLGTEGRLPEDVVTLDPEWFLRGV